MTSKSFYCDRTNAPKSEKSRCGLFNDKTAFELGQHWADKDQAPVHIIRSNGSGQIEMHVATLHPKPNA